MSYLYMGIGQSRQKVLAAQRLYHSYTGTRQTPLEPHSMSQTMSRLATELAEKAWECLDIFGRSNPLSIRLKNRFPWTSVARAYIYNMRTNTAISKATISTNRGDHQ